MRLRGRVERLEGLCAAHADGCPRCSGTTVVSVNGTPESVGTPGGILSDEEAAAFVAQEEDGRCPVCGTGREEVTVGWWDGGP